VLKVTFLDRLTGVSAETFCEHHTEDRSPSFASGIEQVISHFENTIVDTVKISLVIFIIFEEIRIEFLKLF
jgi:hypothetical protein